MSVRGTSSICESIFFCKGQISCLYLYCAFLLAVFEENRGLNFSGDRLFFKVDVTRLDYFDSSPTNIKMRIDLGSRSGLVV